MNDEQENAQHTALCERSHSKENCFFMVHQPNCDCHCIHTHSCRPSQFDSRHIYFHTVCTLSAVTIDLQLPCHFFTTTCIPTLSAVTTSLSAVTTTLSAVTTTSVDIRMYVCSHLIHRHSCLLFKANSTVPV